MRKLSPSDWLAEQIRVHVGLFFTEEAASVWNGTPVSFCTRAELAELPSGTVGIVMDYETETEPQDVSRHEFNGTTLTTWNTAPNPDTAKWQPFPENGPLWYIREDGTCTPAFDLFGNLYGLLTIREECDSDRRDRHGRFIGEYSARDRAGLIEVPAFNEAVALLVAAGVGLRSASRPLLHLDGLLRPPVISLSHDSDVLKGGDFWTQAVRLWRVLAPLVKLRLPKVGNLWWALRNAFSPREFYFDNVSGMIDLERLFGVESTFYLLNGTGGRFGARSGSGILDELVKVIPEGWDVGMHYNYDTLLAEDAFRVQRSELTALLGNAPTCGRAHYMRVEPRQTFDFLEREGITVDESFGYPDRIGYRCGIGGSFCPYDPVAGRAYGLRELPLVVMEHTLVQQYGEDAAAHFEKMLGHLARVGGAMTFLIHPGQFFNPEHRAMLGLYRSVLTVSKRLGARSTTGPRLAAQADAVV